MTPEEFKTRMKIINDRNKIKDSDKEADHGDADRLLCETLSSLGYNDGIELFYELDIWYA